MSCVRSWSRARRYRCAACNSTRAERKRNILLAAGVYDAGSSVTEQFSQFETKVVDLATGQYVDWSAEEVAAWDMYKEAGNPENSIALSKEEDIASIRRQAKYATVYLYDSDKDGNAERLVLPVQGYGLWSTLYALWHWKTTPTPSRV